MEVGIRANSYSISITRDQPPSYRIECIYPPYRRGESMTMNRIVSCTAEEANGVRGPGGSPWSAEFRQGFEGGHWKLLFMKGYLHPNAFWMVAKTSKFRLGDS